MTDESVELEEIYKLISVIQKVNTPTADPLLGWLSAAQNIDIPHLDHPRLSLFTANHGFAEEINLAPDIDYENFIKTCLSGTNRLNRLALAANTDLRLYEMDPETRTGDALRESALSTADLVRSMAYGMMAVEPGLDLLAAGAFGHGTQQAAKALIELHLNQTSDDLSIARLMKQAKGKRGIGAVAQIGGYELAAMCGAVIAARLANCPVLLEGSPGYAVFLVLEAENPHLTDHCRLCHVSADARKSYCIDIPYTNTSSDEPGIASSCMIPLIRTHVILNEPIAPSSASSITSIKAT